MHINKGQTLIELLIIMALLAILLPALIGGLISSRDGRVQQKQRIQASQKLLEAKEALRSIRESGWTNIATNGTYHVEENGSSWSLVSGSSTTDGLTTTIDLSSVSRDDTFTIVDSGGTVDPSTKRVEITISWLFPIPGSVSSTFYMTRYLDNATYEQTTVSDFNTGQLSSAYVVNNWGGEVTLGSGGSGDWCGPELTIAALDLPRNGVAKALTVIEGRAFVGTGDNASGTVFADVAITNTNPPSASITREVSGSIKTNDVFGDGNYGYISTDTNNKEVMIIDLTTGSEISSFNADGNADGESIFIKDNVGYLSQGTTLRTINMNVVAGTQSQLGSVGLSGAGKSIVVVGSYAYVAIADNTARQLEIFDISNPASPSNVGYANVNTSSGVDVYVNVTGTRAYLVTTQSAGAREVYLLDVTTKTGSMPIIGSYDTNGMTPTAITVVPGNRAIVVGTGEEEYQVINTLDETSLNRCGGINVDAGINNISSVLESDGDAYSYILTRDASAEFRIIVGGSGGRYAPTGTYESQTFDLGYSTAFNRIIPTVREPLGTNVRFQISVMEPISGSCSGVSYVFTGPGGASDTYYEDIDGIAINNSGSGYRNPGRCFRYRAYLSTIDPTSLPFFEDITINYSP